MRIRRAIQSKPPTLVAVSAAFVAVFVGAFTIGCDERGAASPGSTGPKSWYTIDDGRTWFADAAKKVVPFEHQGKQAYRCFVWSCDGGKTKFVSHLERLKPAARAQLKDKTSIEPWEVMPGMDEIKAPLTGDKGWMDSDAPGASSVTTPRCPDGKGTAEPVAPQ